MCLIAVALNTHPDFPLILAGNRDEFYHRPAEPAGWWPDRPTVLGGRDREAGGTWLGVDVRGRVAAVTNVRESRAPQPDDRSRGELPCAFLLADTSPAEHAQALLQDEAAIAQRYRGFNLLLFAWTRDRLQGAWVSNRHAQAQSLDPGLYGLSNHLLDTPWPKVLRLKAAMREMLPSKRPGEITEDLFRALADAQPADDQSLPEGSIAPERARLLSAPLARTPDYGTRVSSVLMIDRQARLTLIEREWTPGDVPAQVVAERLHRVSLQPAG